jgi:hypothetical protein
MVDNKSLRGARCHFKACKTEKAFVTCGLLLPRRDSISIHPYDAHPVESLCVFTRADDLGCQKYNVLPISLGSRMKIVSTRVRREIMSSG